MVKILSFLLSSIFFLLALLHFYWAMGGKWGFAKALPTNEKGKRMLNPSPMASAIVGVGLSLFGLFYLLKASILSHNLPEWIFQYGAWIIPSIFLLRAIGDFKYVGFFKKVRQTEFGQLDTKFYAPLCLVIALLGMAILYFK